MENSRAISIVHVGTLTETETTDRVVVEEPLEIRLDGHPVAVLMRTPGDDRDLTAGFLITERMISSLEQIRKIEVRTEENRVLVFLNEDADVDPGRFTRQLFTGSSCGLCGKATLDAIFTDAPPLSRQVRIPKETLLAAPAKLRASQAVFASTGGLHAAALFSATGDLIVCCEDIGRHNAVDKIIGRALWEKINLSDCLMLVSGRVSFEIMQKALAASIPAVAAISAPSSLAVEFARRSGQTLVAFLRPPEFNLYTPIDGIT